jgi:hypothetical protein
MNILLAVNSNTIFLTSDTLYSTFYLHGGSLFGGGMRGSRGAAAGGGGGLPRWGAAVLVLAGAWRWGAFSGAVTDGE